MANLHETPANCYNAFGVEFLRGPPQGSSYLATLGFGISVPLGRGGPSMEGYSPLPR